MLEKLYPLLAPKRQLITWTVNGFWKDLGKPDEILDGNKF